MPTTTFTLIPVQSPRFSPKGLSLAAETFAIVSSNTGRNRGETPGDHRGQRQGHANTEKSLSRYLSVQPLDWAEGQNCPKKLAEKRRESSGVFNDTPETPEPEASTVRTAIKALAGAAA